MSTQGLVVDSLDRSLGWPLLSPGWLFTQGIMSCVGKAGCQPVLMASVEVTRAKPQALQANLRCPGWSQSLLLTVVAQRHCLTPCLTAPLAPVAGPTCSTCRLSLQAFPGPSRTFTLSGATFSWIGRNSAQRGGP